MKTRILNILSTIIVTLLIANAAKAQEPGGTSVNHNEQVTIISSFDPSINEAYKINTSPGEMVFNIDKPVFTYQSLDINLPTEITLNPIKPVVINADRKTSATNNSLKLGVGSLFSPYLDFFHSSGQRNDYRFDAHVYQLSTFRNIKDYSPSPETNAYLDLNYRKFFKYHILDAGFKYALKTNRYYGFKPDDYTNVLFNDDRLKQSFNLAKIKLGISSNYSNNKKLNHSIGVESYYYFDKHSTSETFANFDFDVHKNFTVTDMLDYQELGLSGEVSFFGNSDSLVTNSDVHISATPYFTGKYGMFNFYLGLNFNLLSTNNTNFYFYPILDVNINLVPNVLTVFAGIDGNVQKHSYLELTELNPWLSSTASLKWDRMFKAYGGIRGNISQKVNYSVQVYWQKFNDMFFFVNVQDGMVSPLLPYNKFTTIYDEGSMFGITGELTYAASDKVNLLLEATFNSYSLDSLSEAYHKPSSKIKLGASFKATKKIRVWSELYYYGKRVALDLNTQPISDVDLDGFIDLNAGIDYTLTESFSVFLSLNNILNNEYERYYNYPVHGIQIMGGLTYKF
jgi:hypothetical protein